MASEMPPWLQGVAGSAGGIVANAIVYPLDIIKTRLQVQLNDTDSEKTSDKSTRYKGTLDALTKILEEEGCSGLYSGLPGCSIGVASTNFVYFYAYSWLKTVLASNGPSTTTVAGDLGLGTAAGAITSLAITPISTVTTRQQTSTKRGQSMLATTKEIVSGPGGWTALWNGIGASLILSINPAITYGAYSRLRVLLFANRKSLKPHETFLLGALSKMIATFATQPLIVAKATLQSHKVCDKLGRPFKSFQEVLYYIVKNEGILALHKGIMPQLLKGVLVQGILMTIKDRVEYLFILLFRYYVRHVAKRAALPK